jgi:hypothetical protein
MSTLNFPNNPSVNDIYIQNNITFIWNGIAWVSPYDEIFATLSGTETLTNKTIAANDNTISGLTNANLSGSAGITNANLQHSSVTVGDTNIELGATATTLTGLSSVTSTAFIGELTGDVTGTVSDISNHDTDTLTEGSTNLYYTDARSRAAISVVGGGGNVSPTFASQRTYNASGSYGDMGANFSNLNPGVWSISAFGWFDQNNYNTVIAFTSGTSFTMDFRGTTFNGTLTSNFVDGQFGSKTATVSWTGSAPTVSDYESPNSFTIGGNTYSNQEQTNTTFDYFTGAVSASTTQLSVVGPGAWLDSAEFNSVIALTTGAEISVVYQGTAYTGTLSSGFTILDPEFDPERYTASITWQSSSGLDTFTSSVDSITPSGGSAAANPLSYDANTGEFTFATDDVTFTDLTVTGVLTGNLTGDVTGNLTGDVTGDVTGNLTGDVTGDVTGNLTGDVTGNLTGDVTTSSTYRTANSVTVATTNATAIDTFDSVVYRSAKYLVQITQGSNYQMSEIVVIHNGTNVFMTEYAVVETNGSLATLSSNISGSDVRLVVTMGSSSSAVIKTQRTSIVI